jgi:hypothetical protein
MSKCTCGDGVDHVYQVKMLVDQVKRRREDLVIRRSRASGDSIKIVEEAQRKHDSSWV